MDDLLDILCGLFGIYFVGIFVMLYWFVREKDSYFTRRQQVVIGLFLGLIWPYIFYTEVICNKK